MTEERAATDQHARFIKAARELGGNDDPAAFDALFGKLVPPILPERKMDEPKAAE